MGENRGCSRKVMMSTSTPNDKEKRARTDLNIYFSEEDLNRVMQPHEDPLGISAYIGPNNMVNRVIVDNGSFANVLYNNAFIKMGYKREDIAPQMEIIYQFTNITASIAGVITLKTFIKSNRSRVSRTTKFVVVEVNYEINLILGRSFIHGIKVVPSSHHQSRKYSVNWFIATIYGNQSNFRKTYKNTTKIHRQRATRPINI